MSVPRACACASADENDKFDRIQENSYSATRVVIELDGFPVPGIFMTFVEHPTHIVFSKDINISQHI